MKLLIIITLFITLSTLVPPCTSHRTLAYSPHDQSKLPRKLRSIEVPMVQESMTGDYKSNNVKNGGSTVEKLHDQVPINTREKDMQQFMTMDYSRPRRRRPIHNWAVSGAP
ncbi:putative root meristem growth factor 8 [Cinnamomum micranthum f. kanehirae]|uniref:Putative root meristem growth factor 8 n=1 Tax=Cinnamomum micranthum f. kanehirae TaxID=337451 RepID=A0A3S3MRU5_9MAGN|nr:putative root meristem growth factor 8 [Cinnamomum micranthum f. kanehirae]